MKSGMIVSVCSVLALPALANAWEFRCRFIERDGNVDVPLVSDRIDIFGGAPRNIRLQFGVFDDADGPAPLGGFIGWNVGVLQVSGPVGNSEERRNPGRLAPFNFASGSNANGAPPLPSGDPFDRLTEIDATLGVQTHMWRCNADGTVPPRPQPTVRGINTFVSAYAFMIDPFLTSESYTVTASGNLFAALEWRDVANPFEPDCGDPADPSDDQPGSVTYAPFPAAPEGFNCVLNVVVPAPASSLVLLAGVLASTRRRRAPDRRR